MDILPQLLVNSLITGSIYALASAGLALVYGLLRILNFAHGHLLMLGAYFFYLFANTLDFSIISTIILATLCLALVAIFSYYLFINPFLKFNPILVLVSTLALSTIIESSVSMAFGVNVKSLFSESLLNSFEIYNVFITPLQIIIIATSLILLSAIAYVLHFTSLGRVIRALAQNSPAGQSIGVNHQLIYLSVFVFGSLLAGLAGVLIAYETNLNPVMGGNYTIKAFATMILGGLGNLWGTIAGSYILGAIENLSIGLDFWGHSLPAGYKDAFAFLIILLILLFKPEGLFSKELRKS